MPLGNSEVELGGQADRTDPEADRVEVEEAQKVKEAVAAPVASAVPWAADPKDQTSATA
jgi:hypothetical protein